MTHLMSDVPQSLELPGLEVTLDRLVYRHGGKQAPAETPHIFAYFLTIHNRSDRRVVLLGRKWVVEAADGSRLVVEGDKIVGYTPDLAPGERFSYNSFHLTAGRARASGAFHGVDEHGTRIHVLIPTFDLRVPE
jgi:ApaG protein